jgi:hypothetical protein
MASPNGFWHDCRPKTPTIDGCRFATANDRLRVVVPRASDAACPRFDVNTAHAAASSGNPTMVSPGDRWLIEPGWADFASARAKQIAHDRAYLVIAFLLGLWCVGCVQLSLAVHQRMKAQLLAEHQLWLLARRDYLTGLANRASFDAHGSALFHNAQANRSYFTLAVIDLDGFKGVNDTYGHAAGDELLKEVSTRIQALLGDRHFAARLGGDEFAIAF